MTKFLFADWLIRFDCYISRNSNRRAFLTISNFAAHVGVNWWPKQAHITIELSPTRKTFKSQPLDSEVISWVN